MDRFELFDGLLEIAIAVAVELIEVSSAVPAPAQIEVQEVKQQIEVRQEVKQESQGESQGESITNSTDH